MISFRSLQSDCNEKMKIGILRRLDIWIGRPICLLLTVAYRIKKIFLHKSPISNPRRILFIKLFGMGSIILAIPAIKAVKKKYPDASLYFLTFKENESLFTLTDVIPAERVMTVRKDGLFPLITDMFGILNKLVSERIDIVIDFEFFSRFTAILSFFIRSKYRIGFFGFHTEGLKRGSFIDFQINYNHTLHTSKAFFTLLRPLEITQDEYDPSLPQVPPSETYLLNVTSLIEKTSGKIETPEKSKKWVVINPNTSDLITLRKWPDSHVIELARMLVNDKNVEGVIFIGSKAERPYVQSLCASLAGVPDSKIINLAGRTSLRELIDIFHFADLIITNDSGPAHLASLTPTPSIVLFGPETPDLYSPLGPSVSCLYNGLDCQPCVTVYNSKNSYCRDNRCLQLIRPGDVFVLANKLSSRH